MTLPRRTLSALSLLRNGSAVDWLVAACVALCLFARLGAAPLFDVDEGAFSQATLEMLSSGDFGSTTLNGAPRFDKPILVYWLQAASVALFGVNEAALRLPSALCSAVWVGALWIFLRPRWGRARARLAALMLGSCLGVLAIGRAATADALLNMLLCLAMTDLWRILERAPASSSDASSQPAVLRLYLWVALGLLAKGPVAALIPAAVGLLAAGLTQRLPRLLQAAWSLRAWGLLLAVAAPWYIYIVHRHGMDFIHGFLVTHNLGRYSAALEGHAASPLYYLAVGPLLWLPWSGVLPSVLAGLRTHWRDPLGRYMWVWALFVLGFFSWSGTKLPHYLLYGSTPVLAGLAYTAVSITRQAQLSWIDHLSRVLAWAALATLLVGLAFLPSLAQQAADSAPDPLYRTLLQGALQLAPPWLPAAAGVLLLAWLLCCAFERRFAARLACGGLLWAVAMATLILPWLGEVLQGPVRDAAQAARLQAATTAGSDGPGNPLSATLWNLNQPSFAVYLGAPTLPGKPAPGQMALTRSDRYAKEICPDCQVLFEERGYLLIKRVGR